MKQYFPRTTSKKIRAFTLLEVLTSFVVVTMVMLGPLTFSISSASYSRQSKDVITSEYLAQEALELLHHQYDSLYIACANEADACSAVNFPQNDNETKGMTAWRLFKTRLHDTTEAGTFSCFSDGGCSFDFIDMLSVTSAVSPRRVNPVANECRGLSLVQASSSDSFKYYVCSGVTQEDPENRLSGEHYSVTKSQYTRKVSVTSEATFETSSDPSPARLDVYQDDLKIKASVSFRRSNGVLRTIEVTDFIHARS